MTEELTCVGYIDASDGSYHFFVTDRLGNVRVVANAGGGAEQVNHYDPYGGTLSISSVPDTSGNSYKWGGKEWDKSLYCYDVGARLYDPSDLRWGTMDPLCEKYYSLSPYAYCANNPMNLVDPSGMDIWEMTRFGRFINVEQDDELSRVYAQDSEGNRSDQYIDFANDDIIHSLSRSNKRFVRYNSEGDKEYHDISSYTSSDSEQIFSAFKFFSDHSSVEWAVHKNTGDFILGTIHEGSSSGHWSEYGLQNKPIATLHSHPGALYQDKQEAIESMGYGNVPSGDYLNVVLDFNANKMITRHSYVYFPATHFLYYVNLNKPNFIKKIVEPSGFNVGVLH